MQAAKVRRPDLMTADGQLRPGSGIDAVSMICTNADIPVVFVTATPIEVERRMPNYPLIVKPFTSEAVMAAVRSVMTVR
jgi:DNA-binding response OmpR family regulator